MKLDPEFKAQWLAALRSGEYKQGRCALRSIRDEYCCLGVACDVIDPNQWRSQFGMDTPPSWGSSMPSAVTTLPFMGGLAEEASELAAMNDNGNSFAVIADWIEENL